MNLLRLLFVFLGMLFFISASTQPLQKSASNRYEKLYHLLSSPDSLYVYEVSSSSAAGVAYFICFKNASVKSGYYVSPDYLNHLLIARGLMPQDSINKLFRTVELKAVNSKVIISNIRQVNVFGFQNTSYNSCVSNNIDDGAYYQLAKFVRDSFYTISLYEVYEAAKACPAKKEIQAFIQIDQLFKKHFGEPETIRQHLLKEYRNRKI